MRIQDVMTTNVRTVSPTTNAGSAWELMRSKGIHHLVVTRDDKVVGMLSDRDAGGSRGAAVRDGRMVAELMSGRVVTVEPETTIRRAANLMRGRSIGSLVVAKQGRPVGIVTVTDLLDLLGRGAQRPAPVGGRATLRYRTSHRKRSSNTGVW